MNTPETQPGGSMKPVGSALPTVDGYYWMHNIGSEGQHIWRVVDVGYWTPPTERKLRRTIRDGQRVYSQEYISEWEGIAFRGPLLPPNAERSHGADGAKL